MQFLDGQKLSCSVSSRSVAIAMAARLYQSIGVRGTAAYNPRDRSLQAFHIEELLPYRDSSTSTDTLNGLANIVEKYYDQIDGKR